MTNTYQLNKGENYDSNGQILKNFIGVNCYYANSITIEDNNYPTITNMAALFQGDLMAYPPVMGNLKEVNFTNFNTSLVTNVAQMFYQCTNLTNIPNFDTSNVTNMCQMFVSCSKLNTVPSFDTPKVTDMSGMFYADYNLVNIPQFNTSNVTDMRFMFGRCNNLSNASIQNIINMCLNSNVPSDMRNLYTDNQYSPFAETMFDSIYYSNRLTELDNAGWSYDSSGVDDSGSGDDGDEDI